MNWAKLLAELPAIEESMESFNFKSAFINMLATLLFVLALVWATVWLLKKLLRSRLHAHNLSSSIKIVEKRVLGPKAALYLVELPGKRIVISESVSGIALVTELEEETLQELPAAGQNDAARPSFMDFLKKPKI